MTASRLPELELERQSEREENSAEQITTPDSSEPQEDPEDIERTTENGDYEDEEYSDDNSTTCIAPDITHFPNPLIKKEARQRGAVIIHILLAIYMFLGLTVVCDDFFVPSLTRVSDALCLTPDVAGATLMAAGSSSPELATSVIAVFISKDSVSVSSVVGSAVFNITLVIAVCSLVTPKPLHLHWYPVIRDSLAYLVCVLLLLCIMADTAVSWGEALVFVLLYGVYCLAMKYNERLETWLTTTLPVPATWQAVKEAETEPSKEKGREANGGCNGEELKEVEVDKEGKEETKVKRDPLERPVVLDDGRMAVITWYIMFPLRLLTIYTIPDCRTKQYSRYFLLTFILSVIWICFYSYILVWMITIIGFTLTVPDTVMSLTLVAAGVSVQDALSGIAVVKEGLGDMAVSNAIGSNIFDVLICLGAPWLIKTLFLQPGEPAAIIHKGLLYSAVILIAPVLFLVLLCHYNSWRMDQRFGLILLVWYFLIIIIASLYETNTFGNFNPEECESDY